MTMGRMSDLAISISERMDRAGETPERAEESVLASSRFVSTPIAPALWPRRHPRLITPIAGDARDAR